MHTSITWSNISHLILGNGQVGTYCLIHPKNMHFEEGLDVDSSGPVQWCFGKLKKNGLPYRTNTPAAPSGPSA